MSLSVRLSVCLSLMFVHCGHRVQWIPDTFAHLDRWMSLLLTDNASPGSSDGMMPGFLVERGGGLEKLVIVAISLILLTESLDRKHVTVLFILTMLTFFTIVRAEEFSLVISVENALSLKNSLC